jgi:hypothetical protein
MVVVTQGSAPMLAHKRVRSPGFFQVERQSRRARKLAAR